MLLHRKKEAELRNWAGDGTKFGKSWGGSSNTSGGWQFQYQWELAAPIPVVVGSSNINGG